MLRCRSKLSELLPAVLCTGVRHHVWSCINNQGRIWVRMASLHKNILQMKFVCLFDAVSTKHAGVDLDAGTNLTREAAANKNSHSPVLTLN